MGDPENKQYFTPDAKMIPIFGKDKIRAFSLHRLNRPQRDIDEPFSSTLQILSNPGYSSMLFLRSIPPSLSPFPSNHTCIRVFFHPASGSTALRYTRPFWFGCTFFDQLHFSALAKRHSHNGTDLGIFLCIRYAHRHTRANWNMGHP